MYDILLKGGHVIDPKNGRDGIADVGIAGRSIAAVADQIDSAQGRRVVDASGHYVVPGLVDLHAHCYLYSGGMFPDELCFPYGVTAMVDCGGSGWRTFDHMNETVIRPSGPKVFALLNIVGQGMCGDGEQDVEDMDVELTAAKIRQRSDVIVGVKVAHFGGVGWESVDRGVAAARESGTFCLIDQNARASRPFSEMMLEHMNPGDGVTHCFGYGKPMVGNDGNVKPHYWEARERGIIMDVGHGNNSFSFSMAKPAIEQGFPPDTISTDLHRMSLHTSQATMTEVMSKFLAIGMSMADVIDASTWAPAQQINRPDLGNLTPGSSADISVLEFVDREIGLTDSGPTGYRVMPAKGRLENRITIMNGEIRFDRNGMTRDPWTATPTTDLNLPG